MYMFRISLNACDGLDVAILRFLAKVFSFTENYNISWEFLALGIRREEK